MYELARVELLRDLFGWAYERSCRKYTVVRDSVVEPDLLRLKYRAALSDVAGTLIRERRAPDAEPIRALATPQVAPRDLARFVNVASLEIRRLNEGDIARHRIRLADYRAWLAATRAV